MPATTETGRRALGSRYGHASCLLCGTENPWSLGLAFEPDDAGGVHADVQPDNRLQGYDGMLHGGVAAALLDAAMTHCLFHSGVRAVTGELRVRYPHPVPMGRRLSLQAHVTDATPPLYRLKAELATDGEVRVWAQAIFCRVAEGHGKLRADAGHGSDDTRSPAPRLPSNREALA